MFRDQPSLRCLFQCAAISKFVGSWRRPSVNRSFLFILVLTFNARHFCLAPRQFDPGNLFGVCCLHLCSYNLWCRCYTPVHCFITLGWVAGCSELQNAATSIRAILSPWTGHRTTHLVIGCFPPMSMSSRCPETLPLTPSITPLHPSIFSVPV